MTNRIIGYARTSTADQVAGLDSQKRDLLAAGCERIYAEQVSSVVEREQLDCALAALKAGDVLVVTKPDRLARNTITLLTIVADLTKREIGLIILSMGGERMDTRSSTSRLMLTILAGVAEWERSIMLERQATGILKAKADGKYKGRKPTATTLVDSVLLSHNNGMPRAVIATDQGVSLATVARIINAHKCLKREEFSQKGAVASHRFVGELYVAA